MSLLDRGRETVTIYPEVTVTSRDGNTITQASNSGTVVKGVTIQPWSSTEENGIGQLTEENYRVRFPRNFTTYLGPRSQMEWRGQRWSFVGEPRRFGGSARTSHLDYTIRRA